MKNPFHLAIPVNDLAKAVDFYENILGCDRGRESDSWIDFNLFGHQLVCHYVQDPELNERYQNLQNLSQPYQDGST